MEKKFKRLEERLQSQNASPKMHIDGDGDCDDDCDDDGDGDGDTTTREEKVVDPPRLVHAALLLCQYGHCDASSFTMLFLTESK